VPYSDLHTISILRRISDESELSDSAPVGSIYYNQNDRCFYIRRDAHSWYSLSAEAAIPLVDCVASTYSAVSSYGSISVSYTGAPSSILSDQGELLSNSETVVRDCLDDEIEDLIYDCLIDGLYDSAGLVERVVRGFPECDHIAIEERIRGIEIQGCFRDKAVQLDLENHSLIFC
jgi:hypothetical protein